ncbi:MAG: chromosomal replication initiator protein [Planctomycetota bacterium]|jgi:chromosomal replication initiator protein
MNEADAVSARGKYRPEHAPDTAPEVSEGSEAEQTVGQGKTSVASKTMRATESAAAGFVETSAVDTEARISTDRLASEPAPAELAIGATALNEPQLDTIDERTEASSTETNRLETKVESTEEPSSGHPSTKKYEAPDPAALLELWFHLQDAIRARVEPEQFETWFRRAALRRVGGGEIVVAVQNAFARDWLENYYRKIMEQSVEAVLGVVHTLRLEVDEELVIEKRAQERAVGPEASADTDTSATATTNRRQGAGGPARAGASPASKHGEVAPAPRPELLWESDITLNAKFTFDNFVVGPCNRFPHAAAMGAAEKPGTNYNPFFLHGKVGLGKTHLLQSICYMILERNPSARILYLSCETFVNHFIRALENGDMTTFRHKYRGVDVLVVDDIHLLANKERTQEEFFHTFNTLYNAGKQIVLSSDSSPKEIPTLHDRLVSRFKWGMVTEITPPCFETRVAIIKRKSRQRGHELPDELAHLIAERIEDNVRELEGAVTKLTGYADLTNQKPTLKLARETLRDVFEQRKGQPTAEDIIQVVTEHFGLKSSDLQSRRRTQSIAHARQIAMYLARKITRHSLEEIGGYFGGRDHSTVLYAVGKVTKQMKADTALSDQIGEFLERLS